ncbi:MAG: prepilin-type N-terminal cleavage/methylation domain-containing protein [Candidatus Omnitrophica bacterium]|nr:prepilin-type N-terminal cleavage/methylation domain-containing protein [Candidatus Omnitrophota bacterium]
MSPFKRQARAGFTLIEIMIVVAIIALLAAVAIPNVLRGRTSANESAAISNMRALMSSLEMYRSVNNVYPDDFDDDMYGAGGDCDAGVAPDPDYGPPSFCLDLIAGDDVQGFDYIYTNLPAACDNTAGSECVQFTLTADPVDAGRTGTRSFYVDESGTIRHCTADADDDLATVADETLDDPPADCA